MSEEVFLTLSSVFSYLQCNAESRCIVEGETVLNSKHVILIGVTGQNEQIRDILALCLQTSALKSNPHEIKGKLTVIDEQVSISEFTCSCIAGMSGTCKHIAAVLLKCTRCNILSLERLSSTDVKCYWREKKKEVEAEYEAKPLLETTCFAPQVKKNKRGLSDDQRKECFKVLTTACKKSALSLHLKGRSTTATESMKEKPVASEAIKTILACAEQSEFLESLSLGLENFNLKPCCKEIVTTDVLNVKNFEEVAICHQKCEVWYQERQLRITGSRCYSIYTFAKDDWTTKATNYFWPKKFTNKYVEHGLKHEPEALNRYRLVNNYNVCELGLVICRKYPWLAYSPDGVLMIDGAPARLVEIKCPYEGIEIDAINFVHSCSFLNISADEGITLKKKHQYYGQVQLGMAILNLKECDFLVYSSKSKSFLNIRVHFDEEFAKDLINTVTEKYFKYMIHFVCQKFL